MNDSRKIIFQHSSFRTGSTWLWAKFRANKSCLAYYEIFNEVLSTLDLNSISTSSRDWNSHHPSSAPYFLEFSGHLAPPNGVKHYKPEMAMQWFFPAPGVDGGLTHDESAYVESLMEYAYALNRTPVLSCTRSLARLGALKSKFGGFHIVLIRNLLEQWFSYSNQYLNGNDYFLRTVVNTINNGSQNPAIAEIRSYLLINRKTCNSGVVPDDTILIAFLALHLYLYAVACSEADLVLDLNDLASGRPDSIEVAQAEIFRATGVLVLLDDVEHNLSVPFQLIEDRQAVQVGIETLWRSIRSSTSLPGGSIHGACVLIEEFWREYDNFLHYGGNAYFDCKTSLNRIQADFTVMASEREELTSRLITCEGQRTLELSLIDQLRAERDALTAEQAEGEHST